MLAVAGPSSSLRPNLTPTTLPTAVATPDPEAVRKTAAATYLAAAEASNTASKALAAKYKTFGTLARARAYYKANAKIIGTFVARVRNVTVPADTAADFHSMTAKWLAVQSANVEASGAKSWSTLDSAGTAELIAWRLATAASNLVRSDVGLPPVHL